MGAIYCVQAANRADDPPKVPSRPAAGHVARCSSACHSLCRPATDNWSRCNWHISPPAPTKQGFRPPLALLPCHRRLVTVQLAWCAAGVAQTQEFHPPLAFLRTALTRWRHNPRDRQHPCTRMIRSRWQVLPWPWQRLPRPGLDGWSGARLRGGCWGLFRRPSGLAGMNTASSAADTAK